MFWNSVRRKPQFWVFIGRTEAEAEAPILWRPDANWLIGKDPESGKGQEVKGTTEDEMAGWHHWLNGWVWASSGSWWWTGEPGMLQSMGSQRTWLSDWTELTGHEEIEFIKIHWIWAKEDHFKTSRNQFQWSNGKRREWRYEVNRQWLYKHAQIFPKGSMLKFLRVLRKCFVDHQWNWWGVILDPAHPSVIQSSPIYMFVCMCGWAHVPVCMCVFTHI